MRLSPAVIAGAFAALFAVESWALSDYLVCRRDYLKNCPYTWKDVETEDYACLQSTFFTLTIECQALVMRKTKDRCLADAVKICPGEKADIGLRFSCLYPQIEKTSQACQKQLLGHVKLDQDQAIVCVREYEEFCPNAKKTGLEECLFDGYGANRLSVACAKFLALRFPFLPNIFPGTKM